MCTSPTSHICIQQRGTIGNSRFCANPAWQFNISCLSMSAIFVQQGDMDNQVRCQCCQSESYHKVNFVKLVQWKADSTRWRTRWMGALIPGRGEQCLRPLGLAINAMNSKYVVCVGWYISILFTAYKSGQSSEALLIFLLCPCLCMCACTCTAWLGHNIHFHKRSLHQILKQLTESGHDSWMGLSPASSAWKGFLRAGLEPAT